MQKALACVISKRACYKLPIFTLCWRQHLNKLKLGLYIKRWNRRHRGTMCPAFMDQPKPVCGGRLLSERNAGQFLCWNHKKRRGFGYSFFSWLKSAVEQVFWKGWFLYDSEEKKSLMVVNEGGGIMWNVSAPIGHGGNSVFQVSLESPWPWEGSFCQLGNLVFYFYFSVRCVGVSWKRPEGG